MYTRSSTCSDPTMRGRRRLPKRVSRLQNCEFRPDHEGTATSQDGKRITQHSQFRPDHEGTATDLPRGYRTHQTSSDPTMRGRRRAHVAEKQRDRELFRPDYEGTANFVLRNTPHEKVSCSDPTMRGRRFSQLNSLSVSSCVPTRP